MLFIYLLFGCGVSRLLLYYIFINGCYVDLVKARQVSLGNAGYRLLHLGQSRRTVKWGTETDTREKTTYRNEDRGEREVKFLSKIAQ